MEKHGSFTLKVQNPPSGARYWWAEYDQVYSGWLNIGDTWNCPYGAYGATDLRVLVVDASYNVLHDKRGLGPVYDGHNYVYNCATQQLSEVVPPSEFSGFGITDYSKI